MIENTLISHTGLPYFNISFIRFKYKLDPLAGKYLYEILQQMKNNPVMSCFRSKNNQMCAVEKANKE